ncbi:MAG: energy-coupling factor transporter transmembrane protein EcfT [Clostridia bacterium]|nr:energy-coupling factor transporter transmembrane protein EcfT [Clostridia bacterium]
MKSVSLGQYYAVKSPIHSLDPRIKIVLAILYIVIVFLCSNLLSMALLLVSAIVIVALSNIPLKIVIKSVKPILFIIAFTAIINIFWTTEGNLWLDLGFAKVYDKGVINALFLMVRIFVLIIGSSILLTYTTTPIALTDGIERLLSPLKRIGLPVHDFAMIMTIALRFIPTLMEEAEKIMNAQKARGADFTNGSLIQRAKALIPILIPLFSSSIRHALDLATAMECRCYRGGEGRTRMKILKCRASDIFALLLVIGFGAAVVCINIFASPFLPF